MTVTISNSSILKLRILAFYQIIGGLLGFYDLITNATTVFSPSGMFSFFAIGALYVFSIYCGILLHNNHYERGFRLSTLNQLLQIGSITAAGFSFKYTAGLSLLLQASFFNSFNSSSYNYGIQLIMLPTSNLSADNDKGILYMGFNLFAVYGVYFVRKLKSTIKKESNKKGEDLQTSSPFIS